MINWMRKKLLGFRSDDGGAALLYVTIAIPTLLAITSLAVDMGYVWYVKTRLQTIADMSALAGASKLYTDTAPNVVLLANQYAALNVPSNWNGGNSTTVTVTPEVKCLNTIKTMGLTCQSTSSGNTLKVTVTATTPLFFATALGFKTISLSANSMVSGGGSSPPPMNIAIILDATGSMNNLLGTSCGSLSNPTKIQCASLAAKTLLTKLWASVDQVALYTYPSYDANSLKTFTCASGNNGVKTSVSYKTGASPNYQMVGFTTSFSADKGSPPTGGLDITSPMVLALGKTASTSTATDSTICNGLNLSQLGGQGTSIADAIAQARNDLLAANVALVAKGQPQRRNVMIILSDGDANANVDTAATNDPFLAGSNAPPSTDPGWSIDVPSQADQCQGAVAAADTAAADGTWVYSVAFSAPYAAKGSCQSDRPVTPVTTKPATVNVSSRSCTASNKCQSVASQANTAAWTVNAASGTTQTALTVLGGTIATTCTKSNGSTSGTCTTTVTSPTSVKTETYDLSKYDTTACATMIAIASDASRFYSTDGNTKCASTANPNFTDLVSIFNNVAASIMKKRRIPSGTT